MNDDDPKFSKAAEYRVLAFPTLGCAVTSGLFSYLFFEDWGWAVAGPGILICGISSWAAITFLIKSSRLIEREKAKALDALFTTSSATTQTDAEAENNGVPRLTATYLVSCVAMVAIQVLSIYGMLHRIKNQLPPIPPKNVKEVPPQEDNRRPGFELNDAEYAIMMQCLGSGVKVYTNKGKHNIVSLDFSECSRFDEGLLEQFSEDLPRLAILNLRNTPVSDSAVKHLASVQTLRRLRLGGTSVSLETISELQAALPECVIDTERDEE